MKRAQWDRPSHGTFEVHYFLDVANSDQGSAFWFWWSLRRTESWVNPIRVKKHWLLNFRYVLHRGHAYWKYINIISSMGRYFQSRTIVQNFCVKLVTTEITVNHKKKTSRKFVITFVIASLAHLQSKHIESFPQIIKENFTTRQNLDYNGLDSQVLYLVDPILDSSVLSSVMSIFLRSFFSVATDGISVCSERIGA